MIRSLLLVVLLAGCAASPLSHEQLDRLLADPQRSAADRSNDLRRKPAEMLAFIGIVPGMRALDVSAGGGYTTESMPNIRVVARRLDDPVPAEAKGLDLVTLMFNYHDLGHLGVDRQKLNRAVFQALKPGGMYIVADHSGRPGTGISESGSLHRVEEALLKSEVAAAGFTLAAEAAFLRNPGDPRDRETPNPPQPKDEFVLKFVKP